MDQIFKFDETIGYGDSYLEIYFVISKFFEYMQYYMKLLEQYEHIVARDLVTVKRLDEEEIHICSVL